MKIFVFIVRGVIGKGRTPSRFQAHGFQGRCKEGGMGRFAQQDFVKSKKSCFKIDCNVYKRKEGIFNGVYYSKFRLRRCTADEIELKERKL